MDLSYPGKENTISLIEDLLNHREESRTHISEDKLEVVDRAVDDPGRSGITDSCLKER